MSIDLTKAKVPGDLANLTRKSFSSQINSSGATTVILKPSKSNDVMVAPVTQSIPSKEQSSAPKTKVNWLVILGLLIAIVLGGYFLVTSSQKNDNNGNNQLTSNESYV